MALSASMGVTYKLVLADDDYIAYGMSRTEPKSSVSMFIKNNECQGVEDIE